MEIVLFLGAGFSAPAGLPVGNALFESPAFPHSRKAAVDIQRTLSAWSAWRADNPERAAEEFISMVYESDSIECVSLWASLVRFLGYRLADPFATFYQYDGRTSRSRDNIFEAGLCASHQEWWDTILPFTYRGVKLTVITTNWDIWIERALRPAPLKRRPRPGFNYGWGPERLVATTAYPRSAWRKNPRISGSVPVFKLHGSLNWALERGHLAKYGDLRPAFRGDAAIVPPVKCKVPPGWAANLWDKAMSAIANASRIFVVGSSFPEYDLELRRLFHKACEESRPVIDIFDPNAELVRARLREFVQSRAIITHPGLPEGVADLEIVL